MPITVNSSEFKSSSGPLPRGVYKIQFLDCKQGINVKHSCPQDLLSYEIVAPDSVDYMGVPTTAAGRTGNLYITYTAKNLLNCKVLLAKLGIESETWTLPEESECRTGEVTTIPEIQSQTIGLVGRQIDVILKTSPQYKKLPPKPGQTKYTADNELDGDGNPIISGHNLDFFRVEDIVNA